MSPRDRRFLPKCPIFVQDFLGSYRVQRMTAEQRGGYIWLLLLQWQEGGLDGDDADLLRTAGVAGDPSAHGRLLDAFPVCPDGLRRNAKMAQVRDEADAWCDGQAAKSAMGVDARRRKRAGQPDGKPMGQPAGNAGVNPSTTPPTPTPTPTPMQTQNSEPRRAPSEPVAHADASATPSGSPKRRTASPDADTVARRDAYSALLADLKAADAWQSWNEWTASSGARAKPARGQQAAAILNRALREGPARFAEAVEYAIAGNYLQPTYRDAPRAGGTNGTDLRTHATKALDEAMRRQGSPL